MDFLPVSPKILLIRALVDEAVLSGEEKLLELFIKFPRELLPLSPA